MQTFIINQDDKPNIKFKGKLLGNASSNDKNNNRWTELVLYKTESEKYVCQEIGRTKMTGEVDRFNAFICKNLEEVREFFGHGWLAKRLYEITEIEDVVEI